MRRLPFLSGALALLLLLGGVAIAGGEATLVENPDQTGTLTIRLRR